MKVLKIINKLYIILSFNTAFWSLFIYIWHYIFSLNCDKMYTKFTIFIIFNVQFYGMKYFTLFYNYCHIHLQTFSPFPTKMLPIKHYSPSSLHQSLETNMQFSVSRHLTYKNHIQEESCWACLSNMSETLGLIHSITKRK